MCSILKLLLPVTIILMLSACSTTDDITVRLCRVNKKYFGLNNTDFEHCLQDKQYEVSLTNKRLQEVAIAATKGHNSTKNILLPNPQAVNGFVEMYSIKDLPFQSRPGKEFMGKKYVVNGRIYAERTADDGEGLVTSYEVDILAFDLEKDESGKYKKIRLNSDLLNNYQKRFLGSYCDLKRNTDTSLCRGRLYIRVLKSPLTTTIRPQLAGAEFEFGDENTAISATMLKR